MNDGRVHAFDVLADPVRRRVLALIAESELTSGDIATRISGEFGITAPAVSQHLKVLRENGFATVRAAGTRRLYALDPAPLAEVDAWLAPYRALWTHRLDALDTEIRRGRRKERTP